MDPLSATDAERRTHRAWEDDGLQDLTSAPILLIMAAWFIVPSGYRLLLVPLGVVASFGLIWLLDAAKRRLADPRTGFVRPARPGDAMPWLSLVVVALPAAALIALSSVLERLDPTLPPLEPLIPYIVLSAFPFFVAARRTGIRRYYVLALVPFVTTAIVWPIEGGPLDDRAAVTIALALSGLVSGLVSLVRYLRAAEPLGHGAAGS